MRNLQELINQGLEEEGEEVWDEYRKYDPASLQAIVQYSRQFVLDVRRRGDPDQADLRVLLTRMYVALTHLRLRVIHLQEPPKYGDLETGIPQWVRQNLTQNQIKSAVEKEFFRSDLESHLNGKDWEDLSRGEKSDIYDKLEDQYPMTRSNIRELAKKVTEN